MTLLISFAVGCGYLLLYALLFDIFWKRPLIIVWHYWLRAAVMCAVEGLVGYYIARGLGWLP